MSERKNIDKLFQEKFKDFEMNPPENTWPELERRLKKKKDRKAIPFWWKLSGIAAALVIGFLIGDSLGLFDGRNESTNGIVIQESPKGNKDAGNSNLNGNPIKPHNAIVGNESDAVEKTAVAETSESKSSEANNGNAIGNSGNEKNAAPNKKGTRSNDYKKTGSDAVAVKTNDSGGGQTIQQSSANENANSDKIRIRKKRNQKTNTIVNAETAIAVKSNEKTKSKKSQDLQRPDQLLNPQNSIPDETDLKNKTNTGIASRAKGEQAGGNQNTTDTKSSEATAKENLNKNSSNTTNPVAAAEEKNPEKKLDSTAIAAVVPNALEELLNEKENKVAKGPKLNRWQITSNVAPIYFGSTSGGSPIDSTFANKSKDYNTQVGYGIGLSYAVNKRFTVRTGVNKVSLNYDTNDVQLYAGMNGGGFGNLDSPAETEFLNFARTVSASKANSNGARGEASLAVGTIETDKFTGSINQKMGYIEVPIEVSYAVINKKFGVNVIAGVSTLFLDENEVMLTSEGYRTNLGEANNLNTTHFSTNVGLGIKYSFLKSFEAKFEPIFKYQLNTFSKDNGDFKPYLFGLYTGLSFRF